MLIDQYGFVFFVFRFLPNATVGWSDKRERILRYVVCWYRTIFFVNYNVLAIFYVRLKQFYAQQDRRLDVAPVLAALTASFVLLLKCGAVMWATVTN